MADCCKLRVMHCGDVNMDRALPYREKTWHPAPHTGLFRSKSKRVTTPVSAYLIEHPQGRVLIDTGWHVEMRDNMKKHIGFPNSLAFRGTLPEGSAVHEQLEALGLTPRDLDFVILTHLHADHVSGLPLVRQAKNILTTQAEWVAANREFGYNKKMWNGVKIDTFEPQNIPFGPYQKGLDLFGDGLLHLVFTPGHSRGQLSVLVKVEGGYVLLATDVGYSTRSWNEMILPGVVVDEKQARDSLQWVRDFSRRPDCLAVLANHDPDVAPCVY
ncbi:N-acyl homoserine lactonase family protein [Tumebacillus flagellatus]|uniref:Beta-lactamase n=1 Tax=Tumebacillus flagellatus TaxID=1157490 RepID=A0A074M5G7_9BACL|nr:N-acyl homoserine lactonase family protein [Tumebacillus flagellatus]KEO81232.1 beta-lactamase [Tumebacillus flagellatus]